MLHYTVRVLDELVWQASALAASSQGASSHREAALQSSVEELNDEVLSLQNFLQAAEDEKQALLDASRRSPDERADMMIREQMSMIQSLAADVSELELSREGGLKVIHSAPQRVQLQCTAGEGEERD